MDEILLAHCTALTKSAALVATYQTEIMWAAASTAALIVGVCADKLVGYSPKNSTQLIEPPDPPTSRPKRDLKKRQSNDERSLEVLDRPK